MKRNLTIGIVAVLIVGAIIIIAMNRSGKSAPQGPSNPDNTATSTRPVVYTLDEVSKHPNATSCWSAINGGVYDLTDWIAKHPGGSEAILSICGKDGSEAFNAQHGGQQKQADILATFKIGELK